VLDRFVTQLLFLVFAACFTDPQEGNTMTEAQARLEEFVAAKMVGWKGLEEELSRVDRKLRNKINGILEKHVLRTMKYVFTTTSCAGSFSGGEPMFKDQTFRMVLVDECAHSTEPDSFLVVNLARERLVLLGDTQQLPPNVSSSLALERGLGQSMFERVGNYEKSFYTILKLQYRSVEPISQLTSNVFYKGEWKSTLLETGSVLTEGPVVFQEGNGEEEICDFSYRNQRECDKVLEWVRLLLGRGVGSSQIAVLSYYSAQREELVRRLRADDLEVMVATVDSFQGKETDYAILSTTRTSNLGFLRSHRRANVATSRGKLGMVIVGNSSLLKTDEAWKQIIAHCGNHAA
jgi:regulator of nonsense transcripts 1